MSNYCQNGGMKLNVHLLLYKNTRCKEFQQVQHATFTVSVNIQASPHNDRPSVIIYVFSTIPVSEMSHYSFNVEVPAVSNQVKNCKRKCAFCGVILEWCASKLLLASSTLGMESIHTLLNFSLFLMVKCCVKIYFKNYIFPHQSALGISRRRRKL